MITRSDKIDNTDVYSFSRQLQGRDSSCLLWFDIETTGLSADQSYLYLIGCCRVEHGSLVLRQFMAEDLSEEKPVLESFLDLIGDDTVLVHFNGSTFDIPYLGKKCLSHNIKFSFNNIESIDIYKLLKPYKGLLSQKSMKQKSLERLMGVRRRDIYDGGELISVYNLFLALRRFERLHGNCYDDTLQLNPSAGLPSIKSDTGGNCSRDMLSLLLLHNYEDVTGMLKISALLAVDGLFHGSFSVISAACINTKQGAYYKIILQAEAGMGVDIVYRTRPFENQGYVIAALSGAAATLYIPVFCGELRLFFPDYKNYYYLPAEDCAVHKSVGEFVDREYRKNATANTCYERHSGCFLPMSNGFLQRCLYQDTPKCKYAYTPLESITDQNLYDYASDILGHFIL